MLGELEVVCRSSILPAEMLLTLSCCHKENTVNTVVAADQSKHYNMLYSAPASPFGVESLKRFTVFCLLIFQKR